MKILPTSINEACPLIARLTLLALTAFPFAAAPSNGATPKVVV